MTLRAQIDNLAAMHHFTLPDISCGHCVAAITEALTAADPLARVDINRDTKTAAVHSDLSHETLAAALAEAGYPPADSST